jgi:hypothetical protein
MVCQQCGRCCRELVEKDFWRQAKLTREQKEILEQKKNPPEKGCEMLMDDTGECLIHKLFGYNAKPDLCRNYPKERHKTCLRERID